MEVFLSKWQYYLIYTDQGTKKVLFSPSLTTNCRCFIVIPNPLKDKVTFTQQCPSPINWHGHKCWPRTSAFFRKAVAIYWKCKLRKMLGLWVLVTKLEKRLLRKGKRIFHSYTLYFVLKPFYLKGLKLYTNTIILLLSL